MTHEILCASIAGLAATGSLGLARSPASRDLRRGQEIAYWIVWAGLGSWLMAIAGLFLFLPYLGLVLLFQLLVGRNQAAIPEHLQRAPDAEHAL